MSTKKKDPLDLALQRALKKAQVKFLRYQVLDIANAIRCKVIPLSSPILRENSIADVRVQIATVCVGGNPSFADAPAENCGLDAKGCLSIVPDMSTMRILPYAPSSALLIGDLVDADGSISPLCCRSLLRSVLQHAKDQHDMAFNVGAEIEFVLFDANTQMAVDHSNFAYTQTLNQQQSFIDTLYQQLQEQDIPLEMIHAESAPGQLELVLPHSQDPIELMDNIVLSKQTIQNVARSHGLRALFLPKIWQDAAGNGLHLHLSMKRASTADPIFQNKDNTLSNTAQCFIEGILLHLPALLALSMPTTNSFRRVRPGCWTGAHQCWAHDDKESPLRIVDNTRVEYKLMDSTANVYLALAAILHCGLDGIEKQVILRPPRSVHSVEVLLPQNLLESLDLLEANGVLSALFHPMLKRGYLAIRKAEANYSEGISLDEDLRQALLRA